MRKISVFPEGGPEFCLGNHEGMDHLRVPAELTPMWKIIQRRREPPMAANEHQED
jgi:hypothetical protein